MPIALSKRSLLYCVAAILLSLSNAVYAAGTTPPTNIEMLPPTNASGVCPSGYNQALIFTGNPNGAINCVPLSMDPVTGNFTSDLVVNENWSPDQALEINSNQIWKSVTKGDSTLYFQYNNPGGAVEIGGSGSGNNLIVNGFLNIIPAGTVPTGYPTGWGGGIHTWDLYANGSVAVGDTSGNMSAYITNGNSGQVYANSEIIVGSAAAPVTGNGCTPNGALASDSTGKVYNCISGTWKSLGGGSLVLTETVSGGTGNVTSASAHALCVQSSFAFWAPGHLYTINPITVENSNGTWSTRNNSSSSGGTSWNETLSCYDIQ